MKKQVNNGKSNKRLGKEQNNTQKQIMTLEKKEREEQTARGHRPALSFAMHHLSRG
jgi:hypothetical protein